MQILRVYGSRISNGKALLPKIRKNSGSFGNTLTISRVCLITPRLPRKKASVKAQ